MLNERELVLTFLSDADLIAGVKDHDLDLALEA